MHIFAKKPDFVKNFKIIHIPVERQGQDDSNDVKITLQMLYPDGNKKDGYHQLNVRQLGSLRPWDYRGKCYMDRKRIQCSSNASQHVPISEI